MTDSRTTPISLEPEDSDSAAGSSTGAGLKVMVRVPGPLRELTDGLQELTVASTTVGAAVDEVLGRYPALRRHLRTEAGSLREHVNLFVNEDDVRYLGGESTALRDGDVVTIVPSIAGG